MPDIKLKTRIQNKYKTLDEWNAIIEGQFTPLKGEVCYAVENNTLYQKIGDGITDFTKLEWLNVVNIDEALTIEGAAADAKAVGDRLTALENKETFQSPLIQIITWEVED